MDFCDVCERPGSLVCSTCLDTVYCSKECQLKDHPEHCQDCIHPSQMDRDDLFEEIKMHIEHADEDHDSAHVKIGLQIINGSASVEEHSPVIWLLNHLGLDLKRSYNRRRVRHQRRRARRQIRRTRRERRKARRGTRQAKALGREKGRLGRAKGRTEVAKRREDTATFTSLKRP